MTSLPSRSDEPVAGIPHCAVVVCSALAVPGTRYCARHHGAGPTDGSVSPEGFVTDYEFLRDEVSFAFNPPDDDGGEAEILAEACRKAAAFIAAQPCGCTSAMVEDMDACPRCRVLGRLGDEVLAR